MGDYAREFDAMLCVLYAAHASGVDAVEWYSTSGADARYIAVRDNAGGEWWWWEMGYCRRLGQTLPSRRR